MSSQTVAPADTPTATGEPLLTQRQILFIIFGLMAAMFLSSLNQTVVGTSMRTTSAARRSRRGRPRRS